MGQVKDRMCLWALGDRCRLSGGCCAQAASGSDFGGGVRNECIKQEAGLVVKDKGRDADLNFSVLSKNTNLLMVWRRKNSVLKTPAMPDILCEVQLAGPSFPGTVVSPLSTVFVSAL